MTGGNLKITIMTCSHLKSLHSWLKC